MTITIDDPPLERLIEEMRRLTGQADGTAAIRWAIEREMERAKLIKRFEAKNAELKKRVAALGPTDETFDMKAFRDETWARSRW
ncbi:MAG: type II toxin-antitoxin system VapB family antitoxin [Fulvimarina manganoxydans]|uniref:type II toxin-antitoxin system VapB family antitoxin n=1 Tax=Fulvimarina manganoxydans TaxID=937218 RepID=UPI002354207C|nr:type II toxin-antitoxin system VapB family antitoxin [Fulvimarina manganoxydans]MCK5933759.1 type II toxin-antitoxin system VapB family antitoxin [Fulvimarina manganoxydans]